MNKPYVVYHSPCLDGLGAAYAARTKFGGDGAIYTPWQYGEDLPPIEDGATVFFLDITPRRPLMLQLAQRVESVTVVDHHKTAQEDLIDLPENVTVHFDVGRSGAQLAWAYFKPGEEEPQVISHIADRDLWAFELKHTEEITAALMSFGFDLENFVRVVAGMGTQTGFTAVLVQGEAIGRMREQYIRTHLEAVGTAELVVDGVPLRFPVCNVPAYLASEVGNRILHLDPDAPFSGCFRDHSDGRRFWSLRSQDEREDVRLIAQSFGGGGHRNAAGMSEMTPGNAITILPMRWG